MERKGAEKPPADPSGSEDSQCGDQHSRTHPEPDLCWALRKLFTDDPKLGPSEPMADGLRLEIRPPAWGKQATGTKSPAKSQQPPHTGPCHIVDLRAHPEVKIHKNYTREVRMRKDARQSLKVE